MTESREHSGTNWRTWLELARATVPLYKPALLVGNPANRMSILACDIHASLIIINNDDQIILGQLLKLDKAGDTLWQTPCPILICNDGSRVYAMGKDDMNEEEYFGCEITDAEIDALADAATIS